MQRRGAPGAICLAAPCCLKPNYRIETPNDAAMAIGPAVDAPFVYDGARVDGETAVSNWRVGDQSLKVKLTAEGLALRLSGKGPVALTLPALAFDGKEAARVEAAAKTLTVTYRGWVCRYATGGAIVDTDGKNVTWSAPFEAPTGYTVKSITLPSDTSLDINKANGSVGSMPVTITGVGTGATAIVEYDMTNRKATGIRVTSPGFGYAASGTTAAVVKPTKHSGTHACTVVTEKADTTGGLTKRGAGTLTVSAANTYGGATRLEGGTLAFTSASGIPSGSTLEFAAAALKGKALDTPLLTAPAYANNAIRITEADTLDAKTFGKMQTLATFTAPLASVPAFTLVGSDGQTISAGTDWKLALSPDGKSIRFGANRGMTLLIR